MNPSEQRRPTRRRAVPPRHSLAFGGLILFTVLLYVRPNEILPIGTFPIVKIMTLGTLVAYVLERFGHGATFSIMPRPFIYLLAMSVFVVLSIPMGLDASASLESFIDIFLKVLLIFLLIINVVTSFRRLRLAMEVTVLCAGLVAALTLTDYARGKNLVEGYRAAGALGGIFGNPNDLALAMNVLLPIAVGLALMRREPARRALYLFCALLLSVTSIVTYSRAGIVTMAVAGAVFLAKLGRRYPIAWVVGIVLGVAVLASSPGRIFTLFNSSEGNISAAESASNRWELVKRSVEVMGANPIRWLFGIGINNFHIVSTHELVNHNAYLQVFNEIGLPGLIFYLLFLWSVIAVTGRIARDFARRAGFRQVWLTAVALQTSLVAYVVGSSFASVAFLWYVYYPAAFAVCLHQLLVRTQPPRAATESPPRVWYLRRA